MMSLLPQIQLICGSFLVSFLFSFIFVYLFHGFIKHLNIVLKWVMTCTLFILFTHFYFKLCLYVYEGVFSYYQLIFLLLGVYIFYHFYFPYYQHIVIKRENKTHKIIEKSKKTLYNLFKKMGGKIHGRNRKKRKQECINN